MSTTDPQADRDLDRRVAAALALPIQVPPRRAHDTDEWYIQMCASHLEQRRGERQREYDAIEAPEYVMERIVLDRDYAGTIPERLRQAADDIEAATAEAERVLAQIQPTIDYSSRANTTSLHVIEVSYRPYSKRGSNATRVAYRAPRRRPPTPSQIRGRKIRFADRWGDPANHDDTPF